MKSLVRFIFRRFALCVFNFLAVPTHLYALQKIRFLALKAIGVRLGDRIQLSEDLYIHDGRRVIIADGVRLGCFCRIWDFAEVKIGVNLLASQNLTIISATHDTVDYSSISGPVDIGDDCWFGANVTIVGPVRIGRNVIVGAGSVVLKDLPDSTICAGVPCKVIRNRS